MRQVILHVGMHKTGTSSIQDSINNIDSDGFRTIGFAEKNHSIPMYTIFSENRLNYHIWKNKGYNDNQIIEKKVEYENILEEEIRDESVDCFLISGEDMSGLTESEQISLCEFFKERNFKVRVIYVVRDPISFAASANQQRAKGGAKSLVKINPIYKRRISGFLKGCGHENISTFKYEHLVQGGLIKAFSEIIGVSLEEKPRANESVTSEALALIYALNNINTPTRGSEINFKARETILNEIRTFFSKSNGFKKLMLTKFDLVDKAVAEDLVWLKKNFGISYQLPVKVNHQELVYDEYPSAECLSKFFRGYALKYEASISLADNIEKLYARFLRLSEIDLKIISLINEEKWLDVLKLSKIAIKLGDKRNSSYRKASNMSYRLKEIDHAIAFAKQAVNAKDNNETSRANHKEHLAKLLLVAGKLGDALGAVDEGD
jgi:hypothetical protein